MNFTDKAQIVGVSVLIAVAVSTGLYQLIKPAAMKPLRAPADDAAIIMAGGSLYIGNHPDFWFTPDSAKKHYLNYSQQRQVYEVDFTYYIDGVVTPYQAFVSPNTQGSVLLDLCQDKNTCTGNNIDTITLGWSSDNYITIFNTLGKAHKLSPILPYLRAHARKNWIPKRVVITTSTATKTLDCTDSDDGTCTITVHTCDVGATNCGGHTPNN